MEKLNKLLMINVDTHKLPYGTIVSAIREHSNHKGYIASTAESNRRVYVAKTVVKEI